MKYTKLNQFGLAHYILPVIVVGVIAAIGTIVLTRSHAATYPYVGFANDTSAIKVANTVFTSQDAVPGIGTQYITDLVPGAKMSYAAGFYGKVPLTSVCYEVRVYNSPKSSTQVTSANVGFSGQGATRTVNLPADNNYHNVCVTTSTYPQVSWNVWNQSDAAYVLVYQAVLHY